MGGSRLLMLVMVFVTIVIAGCDSEFGDAASKERYGVQITSPESDSVDSFGAMRGVASDCGWEPGQRLIVRAIPMPAPAPEDTSVGHPLVIRGGEKSYEAEVDSSGCYVIPRVPVGHYQVAVLEGRGSLDWSYPLCEPGAVDYVRVAKDSASIVDVAMLDGTIEIVHMAVYWEPWFEKLGDCVGFDSVQGKLKRDSE